METRAALRVAHPDWHNAPVPSWGLPGGLLIVGLAPGRTGANRTGRPFVGDASGSLLQRALERCGALEDGALTGVRITNAVACFPPKNRPLQAEIRTCGDRWLATELASHRVVLALGGVAHRAVLQQRGVPLAAAPFGHGAVHELPTLTLWDSYHPSPLNTRTGRLSPEAFCDTVAAAVEAAAR